MSSHIEPPPTPRRGVTLRVLIVCRISGPHQDEKSLADQEARARAVVAAAFAGPVDWVVIASRASGEYLDRTELAEIERHLESQDFDLLITEDLGRIARRTRAYDLCELAEDAGTRVVALNDAVDTGRDGWQMHAFFAVVRHEMYNKDTAERIRRSLRNRFTQGGVIQYAIYGIVKPPGAKHDSELSKDPAAEPVYDRMFTLLEGGATYAEVADALNAAAIPPGPYARGGRWTGRLVYLAVFNPIVKGVRVRNVKWSKRKNKTGRRRAVKAPPEELLERAVPHLAFIDAERYDRVVALLKERNAKYRRRGADGRDARAGIPRKRTRWPGQHLTCGICGRLYYWGGCGRKTHLMCSGNHAYACWNGVNVAGAEAVEKLAAAIEARIAALPDFDAAFGARLAAELEGLRGRRAERLADVARRESKNAQARAHVLAGLRAAGPLATLVEDLKQLEAERDRLLVERTNLERLPAAVPALPSRDRLAAEARSAFALLARDSEEFGRLMRRLVPRLEVRPYRPIDGGQLVLRAHLTLDLVALAPEAHALEGLTELLRHELVVDLFDPPQRIAYLERVRALKAEKKTQEEIARELNLTKPAVVRAAALDRLMRRLGVSDPYAAVTEPPADQSRMRRHKHARYRFEPLREGGGAEPSPAGGPEAA